jgi:hypothetical protein
MLLTLISNILIIAMPIISTTSASPDNGDINVQVVNIGDGRRILGSEGTQVRFWGPDMSGGAFNRWTNFAAAEIAVFLFVEEGRSTIMLMPTVTKMFSVK